MGMTKVFDSEMNGVKYVALEICAASRRLFLQQVTRSVRTAQMTKPPQQVVGVALQTVVLTAVSIRLR
jgi:hypothetical protein